MIPSGCRVHLPVPSPTSAAFPMRFRWVGFPEFIRKETSCGMVFEIVAIPYVQASWLVCHPGPRQGQHLLQTARHIGETNACCDSPDTGAGTQSQLDLREIRRHPAPRVS